MRRAFGHKAILIVLHPWRGITAVYQAFARLVGVVMMHRSLLCINMTTAFALIKEMNDRCQQLATMMMGYHSMSYYADIGKQHTNYVQDSFHHAMVFFALSRLYLI